MNEEFKPQAFQSMNAPVTSPVPRNNIFGGQVVDKVHKAVVIDNPTGATTLLELKAGAVLAKANDGRLVLANAATDNLYAILLEDIWVDVGENVTAAVALAGNFLQSAMSCGPGTTIGALVPRLREIGLYSEGQFCCPTN